MTRLLATLLVLSALAPAAAAAQDRPIKERDQATEPSPLEQAREEAGRPARGRPNTALPAAGTLTMSPSELLASATGTTIRFTATLARARAGARLTVRLPAGWNRESASGIRPSGPARAARGDAVTAAGRDVGLRFRSGERRSAFSIRNDGIPAGTYELPVRLALPGGPERELAPLRLVVYAAAREGAEGGAAERWARLPRATINASADTDEQSETAAAVSPGDPLRFAVGINGSQMEAYVTNDGGASFTDGEPLPAATDVPGTTENEDSAICCDPMFAAGAGGDLWFGGLSEESTGPSRIVVNRIAAGETTFQPLTVGLPVRSAGTAETPIQDKPMMTIDNNPLSPHQGRLYVVWDEPFNAGVRVVLSHCDTVPAVANCDDADAWSTPVSVTSTVGSYIYADVAAAPDGRVYVTWWDYSAANAIRGTSSDDGGVTFAARHSIAILNNGLPGQTRRPLPFGCPILVQPGGRVGAVPSVEVAPNGRVYVAWGDLRLGSGTTRCEAGNGRGTRPRPTNLTWDAFVASAAGALPGRAAPSATVGTRLHTDGTDGLAANSDEFFPWLAVDQSTSDVWADFYSTGHDTTKANAHFYAVRVATGGGPPAPTPLTRVSAAPSSYYSATSCCNFANDFGDYEGLGAGAGAVVAAWSDNSTGTRDPTGSVSCDGEAFVATGPPVVSPPAAAAACPRAVATPTPTPTATATATATATVTPPPLRRGLGDFDVESRQLLRTVLRRGLRTEVFCLASCTATATVRVGARTARRYRIPRQVGRMAAQVAAGRYRTLRIKFARRVRHRIRRARQVKVVARVTVGGVAAGDVGVLSARVKLVRRL